MRIVVIGATGTIGRAVVEALSPGNEVIAASRSQSPIKVDIADKQSVWDMFVGLVEVDAVVCAAGEAKFAPMNELTEDDYAFSIGSKLMGQASLARMLGFVRDNGSITLTSGVLAQKPMKGSAAISMVNAGLEGFVRAAALETVRGIRINVVSPPWVTETLKALGMDPSGGMPAAQVAKAYVRSVTGKETGAVIAP